MFRYKGEDREGYKNSYELSDGRMLTIKFACSTLRGGFHDPDETECSETDFFIDGEECTRDELPSEVTDELIERLEREADEDSGFEAAFFGD